MREVLGNTARSSAIRRLLEMGALRTKYVEVAPELLEQIGDAPDYDSLKYECTEFGEAVIREAGARMGMLSPELGEALAKQLAKGQAI